MSRNTVFSRTNATVRHVMRSVIRDCAVWMIGALWPSSRPATTTEMTPEACTSSAATNAANGVRNEIAVSISGSVICLRSHATRTKTPMPISSPPPAARTKSTPTSVSAKPPEKAAMAVRRVTSALASLRSDSPSRIVTTRRGSPIRRATAVAATASGGATTAPIAMAAAQPMPGRSACTTTATASDVSTTRTTESRRIDPRLALKSTSDVWIAAA